MDSLLLSNNIPSFLLQICQNSLCGGREEGREGGKGRREGKEGREGGKGRREGKEGREGGREGGKGRREGKEGREGRREGGRGKGGGKGRREGKEGREGRKGEDGRGGGKGRREGRKEGGGDGGRKEVGVWDSHYAMYTTITLVSSTFASRVARSFSSEVIFSLHFFVLLYSQISSL